MNIQWFPGHMAKTRRILEQNIKLVDIVVELLDARIPYSSKNPEIDAIAKNKKRIILLNKADLSDEKILKEWEKWYSSQNICVMPFNSLNNKKIGEFKKLVLSMMEDKFSKDRQKGRIFRAVRIMVVGIPNVGKSSFINRIAGKSCAVTGDRPGVTRNKQWIRINEDIELLDTPGILWPKFDDERVGLNLAYTGAVKDDVIDIVELSIKLLDTLKQLYPERLKQRYKFDFEENILGHELLEKIGRKRGTIISGGEVDFTRASTVLLDEFRAGKLGNITLERPNDFVNSSETK